MSSSVLCGAKVSRKVSAPSVARRTLSRAVALRTATGSTSVTVLMILGHERIDFSSGSASPRRSARLKTAVRDGAAAAITRHSAVHGGYSTSETAAAYRLMEASG